MPWSELERRLSWGKAVPGPSHPESRHRQPYEPPPAVVRRQGAVPYAELHCHTNFSFLDGASHPEELVEEAARGRGRADLVAAPGRGIVAVGRGDPGDPAAWARKAPVVALPGGAGGVDVVATNTVHYAAPARRPLAPGLAAVRARRSLDE